MFAAFPMYDSPWTRAAWDDLWGAVARRLPASITGDLEPTLRREDDLRGQWRDPGLVLGMTCGYPYVSFLRDAVRLVATPTYRWPGCQGTWHRSFVIVRSDSGIETLEACRGLRFAMNEAVSNSGMNLPRALFAPLARDGRFFGSVIETGAHMNSMAAVRENRADVAAVDCVTYGLAARHAPDRVAGLRILAETPPTPCLPFIMATALAPAHLETVRAALLDALADPLLAPALDRLGLSGASILGDEEYEVVLDYERTAAARGYPVLA